MLRFAVLGTALVVSACGNSVIGDGGETGGTGSSSSPNASGGVVSIGTEPSLGAGTTSTGGATSGSPLSTDPVRTITQTQLTDIQQKACAGWAYEPEMLPAKLELVVDVSSSMNETATGSASVTKWEATRDAMLEAVVGVTGPGLSAGTAVGLLFYPGPNKRVSPVSKTAKTDINLCIDTGAEIPMAVLGDASGAQRTRLRDAFASLVLGQGTPTHDAYKYALNNSVLSDAQKSFSGNPYMLLITDGLPTLQLGCFNTAGSLNESTVPSQPIVDEVAQAFANGVSTFVIGSPGSEGGRAWLSAAARAGGTAPANCSDTGPNYCHMDMTTAPDFSVALQQGLTEVVARVTTCKFAVPTTSTDGTKAVDPNNINPVISFSTGTIELIGRDSTNGCAGEGFKLNSNTELELCPATCDRLMANAGATVQFLFSCASGTIEDILQ